VSTNRQGLLNKLPALAAYLCREARVDSYHSMTSSLYNTPLVQSHENITVALQYIQMFLGWYRMLLLTTKNFLKSNGYLCPFTLNSKPGHNHLQECCSLICACSPSMNGFACYLEYLRFEGYSTTNYRLYPTNHCLISISNGNFHPINVTIVSLFTENEYTPLSVKESSQVRKSFIIDTHSIPFIHLQGSSALSYYR
jgi:hypothetical protein